MSFLGELKRLKVVIANGGFVGCDAENEIQAYLYERADKIAALVDAVSQEHGGTHYESDCPICVAITELNGGIAEK